MDSQYKYFQPTMTNKNDEKDDQVFNSFFNALPRGDQNLSHNTKFFGSSGPFDGNFNFPQNNIFGHTNFSQPRESFNDNFQEIFAPNHGYYPFPPGIGSQVFSSPSIDKKNEDIRRNPSYPVDNDFSRKLMEKSQKTTDYFGEQIEFPTQPLPRTELVPPNYPQNHSVSPMIQPVSRPLGQIKQPFSPQIMPRNLLSRGTTNNKKNEKRGSIPATKVEEIMSTIETYKINPISLLNEISTKIKKKVDYPMIESPFGKIRVFECTCKLDKENIGTGKGNSKQAAKTEAAKEGVKTLLSKESYMPERAAIILSVQKIASGQNIPGPQFQNISPIDSPNLSASSHNQHDYVMPKPFKEIMRQGSGEFSKGGVNSSPNISHLSNESDHMNDSPLYELNVIAKECFIEPVWNVTSLPNANGDFEAEVRFDKLIAHGKGRRKQDAKREAAANIIYQIRSNQQLKEKFTPKTSKKPIKLGHLPSEVVKEKKRRFFESALEGKFFEHLYKEDSFGKDDLKKLNNDFENQLTILLEKFRPEFLALEHSREFYKKVIDYTTMSIANPKQILIQSEKHLADLVLDCHLVPIGSFALECLRNDKMVIDTILTFKEKSKSITDLELLELLKESFEDCQKLDQSNKLPTMEFNLKIVTKKADPYLEITETGKLIKLRIFASNISKHEREKNPFLYYNKYDPVIVHLKRIFQSFEDSQDREFKEFRNLLSIMRIWRESNQLDYFRSELLDLILLNDYFNNKSINLPGSIINCLMILSNEEFTLNVLSKFDKFYEALYTKMTEEQKTRIFAQAKKSLHNLFRQNFVDAKFA